MEFKNPYLLIIGVFAAIIWLFDYLKLFKKPELHFYSRNQKGQKRNSLRFFILLLGLLGWGFISFALMGPRMPHKFQETNIEVNDIFFVVDVSRSMLAEDFEHNRLEAAKRKIRDFISLRPKDRIGIVMFSEQVFTLLPLTTDIDIVKEMVDEIRVGFLGSGTNIGDALGLAVGRSANSLAENKIIILLTDGVNNVGNLTPIEAAEKAKDLGIKVYSIGIGSDQNARIPVGNGIFGTRYQTIPGGSIDLKTLDEIAKITGGKSYVAKDEAALKDVLGEIERLERTEIKVSGQIVFDELYFNYLLIGGFLFLLCEISRKLILREVV